MTTFTLKSLLPVQTTHEDMLEHCAAFNLTLISWEKTQFKVTVTVNEDLNQEQLETIASNFNQYMSARLITLDV